METMNENYTFFILDNLNNPDELKLELYQDNEFKLSKKLIKVIMEQNDIGKKEVYIVELKISYDKSISKDSISIIIKLDFSNKSTFTGKINLNPNNNNFIYDLIFDPIQKEGEDKKALFSNFLTDNQKFNIYNKMLEDNYKKNAKLLYSLLDNSFEYLKQGEFNFSFYLSLFTNFYRRIKNDKSLKNTFIEIILYFDLEKIKPQLNEENIDISKISQIMEEIKNDKEIINEHSNKKIKQKFFILILYYAYNYKKNEINEHKKEYKEDLFKLIDFGREFWEFYSSIFFKKNLDDLIEIENILKKMKTKGLINNINFIYKFINETAMNTKLNNLEILNFVKNYYNKEEYKQYRNENIFNGINFDDMKEEEKIEFLKIWKEIKFIDIFEDEEYKNFQNIIISKINDIKNYYLIFQLFGFPEKIDFQYKEIIEEIKDKYKILIKKSIKENLNEDSFIDNSAKLIYILYKIENQKKEAISFIQTVVDNSIVSKILIRLLSKFKNLSNDNIKKISKFFYEEKENLKYINLIQHFKSIDNEECKKEILNGISDSLMIDKNMLFYDRERNEIKALIEFKKIGIFNNINYKETDYVRKIESKIEEISNNIINYEITINELDNIAESDDKLNIAESDDKLKLEENLDKIFEILSLKKSYEKKNSEEKILAISNTKDEINKSHINRIKDEEI